MSRIVAITGGSGFIGRKLVTRHLEAGDTVRILSRKHYSFLNLPDSARFYQADLAEKEALLSFADGADVLYHCAGEIKNPSQMYKTHVAGTQNLLDACRGRIGRWIQLSSVGVYGPQKKGIIREDSPFQPKGSYETTKAKSDQMVIEAGREGQLKYSILRPSNVFGSGMKSSSLKQMIAMIKRGLFFFIGPPGALATYIYVDNVVEALLLCGKKEVAEGRVYILSDYRPLETFVAYICKLFGKTAPRLRLPEPPLRLLASSLQLIPKMPLTISRINALVSHCIYDSSRIEADLKYRHLLTMEEGLSRFIHAN